MMRGPERTAMAVRHTSGEIVIKEWDNSKKKVNKFFKLPIVRGVYNFIASLSIGYKCLMESAELSGLEEEEPPKNCALTIFPQVLRRIFSKPPTSPVRWS